MSDLSDKQKAAIVEAYERGGPFSDSGAVHGITVGTFTVTSGNKLHLTHSGAILAQSLIRERELRAERDETQVPPFDQLVMCDKDITLASALGKLKGYIESGREIQSITVTPRDKFRRSELTLDLGGEPYIIQLDHEELSPRCQRLFEQVTKTLCHLGEEITHESGAAPIEYSWFHSPLVRRNA